MQLIKILVVLVGAEILIVNFLYSIVLWFGFLTKTGNLCIVALLLGWINGNSCKHPSWVVRCPAAVQNECHLVEGTKILLCQQAPKKGAWQLHESHRSRFLLFIIDPLWLQKKSNVNFQVHMSSV